MLIETLENDVASNVKSTAANVEKSTLEKLHSKNFELSTVDLSKFRFLNSVLLKEHSVKLEYILSSSNLQFKKEHLIKIVAL